MAAKDLLVFGKPFLEPFTGVNACRVIGEGTHFGHQRVNARQMIGSGPGATISWIRVAISSKRRRLRGWIIRRSAGIFCNSSKVSWTGH